MNSVEDVQGVVTEELEEIITWVDNSNNLVGQVGEKNKTDEDVE